MSYLRIILDVDAIRYPLTGIGRYVYELSKGLAQQPSIYSLRLMADGRWLNQLMTGHAAEVPKKEYRGWAWLKKRLALVPPILVTYRRLRSLREQRLLRDYADYLYHGPNYFLPPHSGIAVATIHDLSILKYPKFHPPERCAIFRYEWPKTLARAQHLITPSQSIRQEIIEYCGWPAERITAIHLGVDSIFHPRSAAELTPVLAAYGLKADAYCLCVATIEPRKNISGLIEAYAHLRSSLKQNFPLVLIGERGWKSESIHRQIAAAQISNQILYLDYVAEHQLPLLLAGARLFIFPSFYEGFGLPVLEAMASGVPTITSNCPALVELAKDVAFQVNPYDPSELTYAIERGLEDDSWRAQVRTLGIDRARHFTWSGCVEKTVSLYAAVIAQNC